MAQPVIKTSFASGEWAPKLRSRVDIQKYHAGTALMKNFFVDYSGGGASTRQGTQFIQQVLSPGARLIPFQPSSNLSFVLEFGQNYIRFYSNGAIVIDPNTTLPLIVSTPYATSDLFPNPLTGNPGLKFVQDVTSLIITHPSYAPSILTEISATNWSFQSIVFGPTIDSPVGFSLVSNLGAGTFTYGYLVTALDANNQESAPSVITTLGSLLTIVSNPGTNTLTWTAVDGAASYNVYKCNPTVTVAIPSGAQFGFVANVTSNIFRETTPGIAPDFSQGPPISASTGAVVQNLVLTANANYVTVPNITIAAPPSGITARGAVTLACNSLTPAALIISLTGSALTPVGTVININNGVVGTVATATFNAGTQWTVNSITLNSGGSFGGVGNTPPASFTPISSSFVPPPGGVITYVSGTISQTWDVGSLSVTQHGTGYLVAPAVTFSAGAATATAKLGPSLGGISLNPLGSGNPGVPGFYQERLVLAGPPGAVQSYFMSEPGNFFNFSTSFPSQDSDAIGGTIISEDLNDIRSLIAGPTGLIALTGKGAWLINAGGGLSVSNPITPANQSASPQAFNGANDLRPIKVGYNILYGTNKGNYVRDMSYNVYAGIYTGIDISIYSNHLFFGHYHVDWAWSEEPFKILWAVREDGILLSLSYVKEQELIGWAQHDTNGRFMSVCSVIENVNGNIVDAVYVIVERFLQGNFKQNVERFADRFFPYGVEDSWNVDCALQTGQITSQTVNINGDGPLTITGDASTIGNSVTLKDTVNLLFTAPMAAQNWIVRYMGGIYKIIAFTSSSQVTATVVRVAPDGGLNNYTNSAQNAPQAYNIRQPFTNVGGFSQLVGQTVTGVADGVVIPPTVVSGGGGITLSTPATKVTVGLAFTPKLQTLPLDLGEPTTQSKRKKLPAVTLRVADTLGLQVGTSFANVVSVKDFQLGAIPSMSNAAAAVTDLVGRVSDNNPLADGRQILDQVWQEPGVVCIQQNLPYPATIIAVIPEVAVGDTK